MKNSNGVASCADRTQLATHAWRDFPVVVVTASDCRADRVWQQRSLGDTVRSPSDPDLWGAEAESLSQRLVMGRGDDAARSAHHRCGDISRTVEVDTRCDRTVDTRAFLQVVNRPTEMLSVYQQEAQTSESRRFEVFGCHETTANCLPKSA
jgi:hypothetical protein